MKVKGLLKMRETKKLTPRGESRSTQGDRRNRMVALQEDLIKSCLTEIFMQEEWFAKEVAESS